MPFLPKVVSVNSYCIFLTHKRVAMYIVYSISAFVGDPVSMDLDRPREWDEAVRLHFYNDEAELLLHGRFTKGGHSGLFSSALNYGETHTTAKLSDSKQKQFCSNEEPVMYSLKFLTTIKGSQY